MKIIKERNKKFWDSLEKGSALQNDEVRIYIPERSAECEINVNQVTIWDQIVKTIEKEQITKENFEKMWERETNILKPIHRDFRKELRDYGYITREKNLRK